MVLSIVIAAYNVDRFIEKCVISCNNQNLNNEDYEILVINDGSNDDTLLKIKQLSLKIFNLVFISQPNGGLGAARNTGLSYAKGEYIWFIDGDDFLQENCLQKIVDKIKINKLDILFLNYAIIDKDYKLINSSANKIEFEKEIISGGEFYEEFFSKSYTWLYIFRKSIFLQNDIKFMEKINMQDSEILPKIMIYSKKISYLNSVSYYYYQQENSFTNSKEGEKRYNYFLSIIKVKNSLIVSMNETKEKNILISNGIEKKIKSLDLIVFNHLIYFKYETIWFKKIIKLLKANDFFPVKNINGLKKNLIKWCLNNFPFYTKKIIDKILS